MARSFLFRIVVLLGGVLGSGCSEAGGTAPETGEPVASQALSLLRHGGHASRTSLAARASLQSLAARLCDLQADSIGDNARNGFSDLDPDDGGWDWLLPPAASSHSAAASPDNLYGTVALVPWAQLRAGAHGFRLHTAVLDAALGMQNNAQVDSPPDFVYWVLLGELSENTGFAALARARYDAKLASAGGARALAELVRDQRHAQGNDGLIAYDLAWLALGASALDSAFPRAGYDADEGAYARVVEEDLTSSAPLFDVRDENESYYTQGLAWSLLALRQGRRAPALFAEVRSRLLEAQLPSGAWGWNATSPGANLQATAEAVQALALAARPSVRGAEHRAARFLISQQAANGGWLYAADQESPFLDAEIGLALYLTETAEGARDGLDPDGVARSVSALSAPATAASSPPPLARPLSL